MVAPTVLILEDEEMWLARHERRLRESGIKARSTHSCKEALEIARDPDIKFALIDQILYVTPVPANPEKRELQNLQGLDVIRKIIQYRPDIQFYVVTSAPRLLSENDLDVFSRETARFRRQTGVKDVIHKHDIERDPEQEYGWLIKNLKSPTIVQANSSIENSVMPRVLLGLGLPQETFDAFLEQYREKYKREYKSNRISLRNFLKEMSVPEDRVSLAVKRTFTDLVEKGKALEQKIFIEMPGSKKLEDSNIRQGSSAFQILMKFALRAEQGEEVILSENDYQYTPRQNSENGELDQDIYSVQDYAFGFGSDGKKQLRDGIHIELIPEKKSPFKTEISRLRDRLARLNVGPSAKVIPEGIQGSYMPAFGLGIFLYPAKGTSKRQRKV